MTQRSALVTGTSSGIGAAACRRLRQHGWHVVGIARRPSPDADVSICADITRFDELDAALREVRNLDLLVHSAAIIGPVEPLPTSDPNAWRQAVEINLIGTYNVLRIALSGALALEHGIAIHLTSGAAAVAKPYWSAYSASKAGAEHMVRCAAADVSGSGCAVCALDPGRTDTPMQEELRRSDFPDRESFVRSHAENENRSPEEVADAILELAGRDPSSLNGLTFKVGAL